MSQWLVRYVAYGWLPLNDVSIGITHTVGTSDSRSRLFLLFQLALFIIMREIVHLQIGQCGNQIGSKVRWLKICLCVYTFIISSCFTIFNLTWFNHDACLTDNWACISLLWVFICSLFISLFVSYDSFIIVVLFFGVYCHFELHSANG